MSTDYYNAHLKLFLSKIEKAKTSIVPIKTQSADYEICEESVLGNNISIDEGVSKVQDTPSFAFIHYFPHSFFTLKQGQALLANSLCP